jgi:general secretion pathway protein A
MYEQFFGLEDEPFRLTPDPRYLFLSAKHAEALAHLRLGLTESSGFVCITGDVGTGKTTLLRAFLSELGPDVAAAYALTPPLSALELLRRLCREFGLSADEASQSDLVDALHGYLIAQAEAGRTCVVVLDEAQALSVELLEQVRLLLNLETATRKLLRIVLVGQPQLRKLLLDPNLAQLNQRITLRWHLGPLSYPETVAYLHHRLGVASGGRATRLFTRPALRLLHGVSGGVPRLANMVAHRALLAAFVTRETRVARRSVARAYREIQTVPLPGTLTLARRAALVGAGLAIGVSLVAVGAPRLDRLLAPSPSAALPEPAAGAAPAVAGAVALLDGTVPAGAAPALAAGGPPSVKDPPSGASPSASVTEPTPPSPVSAADLAQRLAAVDLRASARAATATVLAAWGERPLLDDETRLPDDLETVAWRRGLEQLQLTANRSMLRLLDLPALLVVRVDRASEPRYVALTGLDESRVVLSVDGASVAIDPDTLQRMWGGQAHVLWKDFDGLGPTLQPGTRGVAVVQLQELLRRAGATGVEPTGTFDAGTSRAVVEFQRRHRLDADGLVGPLTRIVLYAAGSGLRRPALGIPVDAAS